jgi:hypothetical protein
MRVPASFLRGLLGALFATAATIALAVTIPIARLATRAITVIATTFVTVATFRAGAGGCLFYRLRRADRSTGAAEEEPPHLHENADLLDRLRRGRNRCFHCNRRRRRNRRHRRCDYSRCGRDSAFFALRDFVR